MKTKTDRERKAMFVKMKEGVTFTKMKKNKGWHELPNPSTGKASRHQEAYRKAKRIKQIEQMSKEPSYPDEECPSYPDEKYNDMFFKAGKFIALQGLEFTGFVEPHAIAKASMASFEDSIKEYKQSSNIEDATITGIKSFVKNYIITKAENCIIESVISESNIDNKFKAAIGGTVLMSTLSTIVEEFQ